MGFDPSPFTSPEEALTALLLEERQCLPLCTLLAPSFGDARPAGLYNSSSQVLHPQAARPG